MIEFDEKILKKDVVVKVTDETQLMNILKWGNSKGLKWASGMLLLDNYMVNTLTQSLKLKGCVFLDLGKKTIWRSKLSEMVWCYDHDKALLKEKPGFDLDKAMQMYKDIANVVFFPGRKITIVVLKTHEIGVAMLREGDVYSKEKGFLYAYFKALRSKIQ